MTTGDLVTWRPGKPVTLSCLSVVFAVVGVGVGVASSLVVFGVVVLVGLPLCSTPCSNPTSPSSYRYRPHRSPAHAIVSPVGSSCQRPPRRPVWCRIAHLGAVWRSWQKNRGSAWGRFTENIANWFWRIGVTTAEVEVEIG